MIEDLLSETHNIESFEFFKALKKKL